MILYAKLCGGPSEGATPETNEKFYDMVLENRRLELYEIVKAMGISHSSVVSMLNDHLGMRKLIAKLVRRLLTMTTRLTTMVER